MNSKLVELLLKQVSSNSFSSCNVLCLMNNVLSEQTRGWYWVSYSSSLHLQTRFSNTFYMLKPMS